MEMYIYFFYIHCFFALLPCKSNLDANLFMAVFPPIPLHNQTLSDITTHGDVYTDAQTNTGKKKKAAYSDRQHTAGNVKHCMRERVSFSVAWGKGGNSKRTQLYHWRYNSADVARPSLPRDVREWTNRKQPNILFCSDTRMSKCVLKAVSGSPRRDGCVAAWGLVICLPLSRRMNTWDLTGGGRLPDTDRRRPRRTKHARACGTEKQCTCARREDTRTERSVNTRKKNTCAQRRPPLRGNFRFKTTCFETVFQRR